MTGPEFWMTRLGQKFIEGTMPKVADQLERLNGNLEALVVELKLQREAKATKGEGKPTEQ